MNFFAFSFNKLYQAYCIYDFMIIWFQSQVRILTGIVVNGKSGEVRQRPEVVTTFQPHRSLQKKFLCREAKSWNKMSCFLKLWYILLWSSGYDNSPTRGLHRDVVYLGWPIAPVIRLVSYSIIPLRSYLFFVNGLSAKSYYLVQLQS